MAQPSWIGYKLNNRYLIEEELGAGGMSAVYRANDPNLKRVVAIKLIHTHLSNNPDFVRRFETEASSVAQLRHPNIVQVYDFNNDNETYYMVLEFVPGESLQQRLKRLNADNRKITATEAIDLATTICEAVDYAHKRGLVHRDIKPANVMINVQGEPILMDFGIVKILGGTQHTATGAVVGTARYMAPEQIRGESPDHRADIYSLGVMLYEMLSGKPPYEADSAMTIMMMHLNDPVPDITTKSPDIPAGFKTILDRALAKDPVQRYQSAGEMAAALKSLKSTPAGLTTPPPVEGTMVEPPAPSQPTPDATYVEPAHQAQSPQATYVEPAAAAPQRSGTAVQQQAAQTTPPAPKNAAAQPPAPKSNRRMLIIGGAAAVILLIICGIAGAAFLPGLFNGQTGNDSAGQEAGDTEAVAVLDPSETPEPTDPPPTNTSPPPTETEAPTNTPTITPTPTATQPEGPFVLITEITIESGAYNVFYEVFNFEPIVSTSAGTNHMHFYWNIYEPQTVGVSGIGDSTGGGYWVLYDNPNPFKGFSLNAKPQNATQICVLVANYDHSVNLDTGNCFDIPE